MKKFKMIEVGKMFIKWNSILHCELHGMLSHADFLATEMWKKKMQGEGRKEHMQDINKNYAPQGNLAREMRRHSNKYSLLKTNSENIIFLEKCLKKKMEIVEEDI